MWSKISSAIRPQEGNDGDEDASPDPFRANATTYYTPAPLLAVHTCTASREEDIILSLRTQLALQQELCAQFEIDLHARDELVEALTIRLGASEKENDKRKNVIRSWKKKAAFLEKMCCHLEAEERNSLMEMVEGTEDEISRFEEQVQKRLHDQVSQLEREKADLEKERDDFSSEISRLRAHVQQLQKDSAVMEVTIVQLNKQRDQDKEDIDGLNIALESKQQELELVKRKHGARGAAGPVPGRASVAPSTAGNTWMPRY